MPPHKKLNTVARNEYRIKCGKIDLLSLFFNQNKFAEKLFSFIAQQCQGFSANFDPLTKIDQKIDQKLIENGPKMDRKWAENGPKMDQQWTKNGSKMDQIWAKNGTNMDQKWTKNEQKHFLKSKSKNSARKSLQITVGVKWRPISHTIA